MKYIVCHYCDYDERPKKTPLEEMSEATLFTMQEGRRMLALEAKRRDEDEDEEYETEDLDFYEEYDGHLW